MCSFVVSFPFISKLAIYQFKSLEMKGNGFLYIVLARAIEVITLAYTLLLPAYNVFLVYILS